MVIKKQKLKSVMFLFLVFLLFSFFRFYNLDKRVIFDWDQERDAFVIRQILLERKLTLIGPRVLGPEGFFLGPYFSYLLTPFYFLTKLHPQAMIFFIIAYNLGFFFLTFLVLSRFFNFPTALTFLLIWSLHPALIGIGQIAWNPLLVPLIIVASWAMFFLALEKPTLKKWLIVGVLVGLGINFHFQLIFLVPFGLVFLLSQKKNLSRKFAAFFVGISSSFLPLLAFDLRHQFLNSKLLLNFFGAGKEIDYLAWLPVWKNVVVSLTGLDFRFLSLGFYFLVLALGLWAWQKEKKSELRLFFLAFLILWLLFPLGFTIFGHRPSEYYFNFLFPFLALLLSHFLLKTVKSWRLVFLLLLLVFFFRIDQLKARLQPNPLGLFYKERVIQRIAEIGQGRKFNVSFSVPLGLDTGYRYLLEFYQAKQSQNPDDPLFQIVVPPRPENEVFGGIGLQVPYSFQQQDDNVKLTHPWLNHF